MGVGLYSREDSSGLSTSGKKHQDKLGFLIILQIMESPPIKSFKLSNYSWNLLGLELSISSSPVFYKKMATLKMKFDEVLMG